MSTNTAKRHCGICGHPHGAAELFCGNCGEFFGGSTSETTSDSQSTKERSGVDTERLEGRTFDSKYQLIELLGKGGMGAVYRARRIHIGDEVAVKVLPARLVSGPSAMERFRREARAAAMLRHANIVTIHDFSEARSENDPAYIVMELVDGVSLRGLLNQEGNLDPVRAVNLMTSICAGVNAAHRRNVVHRDLKPDNIIVTAPDRAGGLENVKVIDFGIAKLRDSDAASNLTQTGMILGSPHYMSPEQCNGDPLDPRSDIYSLGAILYEMLGGEPPFTGPTVTSVVAKHLIEAPGKFDRALRIPSQLEQICFRALEKRPDRRYQSVELFSADLARSISYQRGNHPLQQQYAPQGYSFDPQSHVQQAPPALANNQPQNYPTAHILAAGASTQPGTPIFATSDMSHANLTIAPSVAAENLSKEMRRMRNFAIFGAVAVLMVSIGVGILARAMKWVTEPHAYDRFVIELVSIASRDMLFGAFLGAALSGIRRRKTAGLILKYQWLPPLFAYGSAGAALFMAPFVLFRTSLIALPLGLGALGFATGLIIRLVIQLASKVSSKYTPAG